ncbi:MAG TPA: hypothetical protein VLX56_03110 [Nitrososphaerales archaeon]|nr:hypothetical protein [Nitrososphaerales archaeon]
MEDRYSERPEAAGPEQPTARSDVREEDRPGPEGPPREPETHDEGELGRLRAEISEKYHCDGRVVEECGEKAQPSPGVEKDAKNAPAQGSAASVEDLERPARTESPEPRQSQQGAGEIRESERQRGDRPAAEDARLREDNNDLPQEQIEKPPLEHSGKEHAPEIAEPSQARSASETAIESAKAGSEPSGAMGTFHSTAYRVGGRDGHESTRFDIPEATFDKRTQFHFEEEKTYEIAFKIDGAHDVKTTHTGSRDSTHVVITVPSELSKDVKPGEKHVLTVESVTEKRTLTVSGEGPTTRLTPQKRALESLGIDVDAMKKAPEEERLVELTVRNLSSEDKSEKTVYGRVQPGEGAMPLSIANIGAKHNDVLELVSARKYTVDRFVDQFNERAGGATGNVRLSLERDRLHLEVDGRRFEAKHHELGVHRLHRFLNLEVEPFKHDIRLWIEGDRVAPKLAQSSRLEKEGARPEPIAWRIKSFAASERGLEVRFAMGDRTVTMRSGQESLGEKMSMEEISEKVKVVPGDRLEANHQIRIEDDLASYINDRMARAKWSNSPYFLERGGIGEDLGAAAWSKMGYEELERHPFDRNGPGRDPFKNGTDALSRNRKTGELVLVELRWWRDVDAGLEKAVKEVRNRHDDEKEHPKYGRISGAYVASLKLDLGSNRGELHVKRAW